MKILVKEDAIYKGEIFDLNPIGCIIGRDEGCDIVLETNGISRRHCQILRLEGKWCIEDLESSNGVFVNENKISEVTELKLKDEIRLAETSLVFGEDEDIFIAQKEVIQNQIKDEDNEEDKEQKVPKRVFHHNLTKENEEINSKVNDIPLEEKKTKKALLNIAFSEETKQNLKEYREGLKTNLPWFLFIITSCFAAYLFFLSFYNVRDLTFETSITPTTPLILQGCSEKLNTKTDVASSALLVLPVPEDCQVLFEDGTAVEKMSRINLKGKFQLYRPGFIRISCDEKVKEIPNFIPEKQCVLLKTQPTGALVKMGGRILGRTPCLIKGLKIGSSYEIAVGGGETKERLTSIDVEENGKEIMIDLNSEYFPLTFTTTQDCEFTIIQGKLGKNIVYILKAKEILTLDGFSEGTLTITAINNEKVSNTFSVKVQQGKNEIIDLFK